ERQHPFDELFEEEVACELGDHLQGARLFEEVARALNDLEALFTTKLRESLAIELEDERVVLPHDEERRCLDAWKRPRCEIRPATSRNHRGDVVWNARRRDECRCRTRARAEVADPKQRGLVLL